MSLGLGLSGLVLLRLLLRMPIVFFWRSCPLISVWEMARFRLVRLGGHRVRKVRGNAACIHDAADAFLYRDPSIAPLLDMRRRFKAVMGVPDAMIRYGSLARSVELTVTLGDLSAVQGMGIGDFHRIVSDVHRRLSDFYSFSCGPSTR